MAVSCLVASARWQFLLFTALSLLGLSLAATSRSASRRRLVAVTIASSLLLLPAANRSPRRLRAQASSSKALPLLHCGLLPLTLFHSLVLQGGLPMCRISPSCRPPAATQTLRTLSCAASACSAEPFTLKPAPRLVVSFVDVGMLRTWPSATSTAARPRSTSTAPATSSRWPPLSPPARRLRRLRMAR